jgi:sugar/nucleoside kinase (ribokinase family)
MTLPIAPRPAPGVPFDVTTFGECSVDFEAVLQGPIRPGTKGALESLSIRSGGQAATAAVTCARLGWKARFAGAVGADSWGHAIAEALAAEGVDARLARQPGVASRTAVVLVDPSRHERTVLGHRDAGLSLPAGEIPLDVAETCRVLIVDATDLAASVALARAARRAGAPVIIDIDAPAEGLDALLGACDVLACAGDLPETLTGAAGVGEALARLAREFAPALVVATLGAEGSLAVADGREIRTPAPAVEVRDTTGAGDAFRGGLAAGWLEFGPDVKVDDLLRFANVVAALSCRAVGAQGALPLRHEVTPWL